MKNLQNFKDFLNESVINEGSLAKKAFKTLGPDWNAVNSVPDEKPYPQLLKAIAKKLGVKSAKDVYTVNSEGEGIDDLGDKIYAKLEDEFGTGEPFEPGPFKNKDGTYQYYDKALNVIRMDDWGAVAFFFTAKSNI